MNLEIIPKSLPDLLGGMVLTVEITVLSVLIGLAFSVPIALARVSRNPLLSGPAFSYIFFFRGTPLLAQIFLIYYGSGQFVDELRSVGLWTFFREPYFCAVLTLTLNTAAYTAEILRGAIGAVPRGEIEAGRACGMSGALLFRRIVLPKAFRIALPAYGNEVVFLFQATSLVSIITLMDLTGVARVIVARTFSVYEIYITAGLIYLAITYIILYGFKRIERRLLAHLRPRGEIVDAEVGGPVLR